jgi:hypothetical protein
MPAGRSAVDELLEERRAEAALEDATLSGNPKKIAIARHRLAATGSPTRDR